MSRQLTDLLEGLAYGETRRSDCPFCYKKNTFTATNNGSLILWNCYSASCKRSGAKPVKAYTLGALYRILSPESTVRKPFIIPESFVSVLQVEKALAYLRRNHCLEAYIDGRADIMWDDEKQRVVFLIKEDGVCYDAVGRKIGPTVVGMAGGSGPKWLRYNESDCGYFVPNKTSSTDASSILLVEDAASACAGSCLMDTMGILGTSISSFHVRILRRYSKVVIALDPDAKLLAIKHHRLLSWHVNAKLWFIPDDLKYFNQEELKELAHGAGII